MKVTLLLCVLAIFMVYAHASRRAATSNVAAQIRFLLDEEKQLRQQLETRVQRLRQQAASLNNTIVPCNCVTATPGPPSSRPVAYTGTIPSDITGLTANTIFNFTDDLQNVGGAFHAADGHFVAPVDGLYGFSLAVYMPVRYTIKMELVANGKPFLYVQTGHYYSGSYNRQENMATNFAVVNITKGTEVYPRYVTGSARLGGSGVPTFSGYLLHEF